MSLFIPQDVIELIIDELRDDNATLHRCAVVSRSFLPQSRKHLFFALHLDHSSISRKHCRRLGRFLARHPEIAYSIKKLYISNRLLTDGETLPSVLRVVPNLQAISIHSLQGPLDWDAFAEPLKHSLATLFKSLATLNICFLDNVPISQLSKSSRLKDLSLVCVSLNRNTLAGTSSEIISQSDLPKNELESLEIGNSGDSVRALMQTLASPRSSLSVSKLQSLSVIGATTDTVTVASEILEGASESIERFSWSYPDTLFTLFDCAFSWFSVDMPNLTPRKGYPIPYQHLTWGSHQTCGP
jgi:hypothetical protein